MSKVKFKDANGKAICYFLFTDNSNVLPYLSSFARLLRMNYPSVFQYLTLKNKMKDMNRKVASLGGLSV